MKSSKRENSRRGGERVGEASDVSSFCSKHDENYCMIVTLGIQGFNPFGASAQHASFTSLHLFQSSFQAFTIDILYYVK